MKRYSILLSLLPLLLCDMGSTSETPTKQHTRNYRVRTKSSGFRPSFTNYTSFTTSELSVPTPTDGENATFPSPTIASSRALPLAPMDDHDHYDHGHDQAAEDILQHHEALANAWGGNQINSMNMNAGHRGSLGSNLGMGAGAGVGAGYNPKYYSNLNYPYNQNLPSVAPRYSDEKLGINSAGGLIGGNSAVGMNMNAYSSQGATYPYNYYTNAYLELLYERERERAARDLIAASSRITPTVVPNPSLLSAAASSLFGSALPSDLEGYGDPVALGSGHHGWGWKEKEHHYVSKVNTNAIGLLGLLGLLSLLSNVLLLLTTTTTTAAGRKKRSAISYDNTESEEDKRRRIFTEVLPYLAPVAHARNGIIPVECSLHGICMTNRIIVKEYGLQGRPAGNRVTKAIASILSEVKGQGDNKKIIEAAGLKGRNQNNCKKKYPVCEAMNTAGPHSIPFVVKMEEVPQLLHKFQKLSASHKYNPLRL